jgi:adenylate cyclase
VHHPVCNTGFRRRDELGTEIERKFLVDDPSIVDGLPGSVLRQGYLSRAPERTVRVRRSGTQAWLTVKGPNSGSTRAEWEWEIPPDDADEMLTICDGPVLEKTRYLVEHDGLTWEVDVFSGANSGLVIAEIELGSADTDISLPPWVGREVTGDLRYYNSSLAVTPIRTRGDSPAPVERP